MGDSMTDRTLRAVSLWRCSPRPRSRRPAFAQTTPRRDRPTQSPAPAPTRPTSPARRRRSRSPATAGRRRDRDHHHRAEARGESPGRADQRPGDRHPPARPAQHLELRGLYQAAAVGQLPDAAAGLDHRLHARRRDRRRRQPLRARCRRSASISTSSRSRRSAERSTSTSTTSPGSRASPGRRARSTAPRARPARSASSPTSPSLGVTSGPRRRRDQQGRARRHGRQPRGHDQPADRATTSRSAAVAFYQRDAGYIDNVFGARTYCGRSRPDDEVAAIIDRSTTTRVSRRRISTTTKIYGGRAALKIDLNDNWTVTPTIMHQNIEGRTACSSTMPSWAI